jgi:hypothetical protein
MVRIVEGTDLVEVLARRDVAHREGRADEIAAARSGQAADALQVDIAKAALEELRAERGDADVAQLLACFAGK